jgi:hypothetical protein
MTDDLRIKRMKRNKPTSKGDLDEKSTSGRRIKLATVPLATLNSFPGATSHERSWPIASARCRRISFNSSNSYGTSKGVPNDLQGRNDRNSSRTDRAVIADVRSRTNDPTVLRSRQTDMRCRTWPKTPKQNPPPAAPRRWRRYARLAWSAATAATPRSEPARRRPVRFGCSGSAATRLLQSGPHQLSRRSIPSNAS